MSGATLQVGDCLEVMAMLDANSIDAICCDPPYGIRFMGKAWDGADIEARAQTIQSKRPRPDGRRSDYSRSQAAGEYDRSPEASHAFQSWSAEWAAAALRVAKPGAHLLAFGGTRTHHRLMCAIEDAGWEIRDCLMFLHGQGFPKSKNLSGEHAGKGTGLKPGWEPIILARKPLIGTVAENVQEHRTGALNIDACRIEGVRGSGVWGSSQATVDPDRKFNRSPENPEYRTERHLAGRWPANVVLDEQAAAMLDEQTGELASGLMRAGTQRSQGGGYHGNFPDEATAKDTYADRGGGSRFFYCAKASRAEREEGLDALPIRLHARSGGAQSALARGDEAYRAEGVGLNVVKQVRNHHPTVKPVALMRWLCRLVTPPGGLVLDPFAGSGTTGVACHLEGFSFFGIDQDPEYIAIAQARIAHAEQQPSLFEAGS
jgi:site-specific DNA-methyltransferase (adenine-specific)